MRLVKKEEVKNNTGKRHSTDYVSKGKAWGVIAAVIGVMIAVVAKGVELDKEEAEANEHKLEE